MRSLGPFTAGASGMPAVRFVAADLVGAGLWATCTTLGYVFADRLDARLEWLHDVQAVSLIAVAIGIAAVVLFRP